MTETIQPEWSWPIIVEQVSTDPRTYHIEADQAARERLAPRMDLISLDHLEADVTLCRINSNTVIHVTGTLKARVTQSCVVSLAPVPSEIEDSFEAFFAEEDGPISLARARQEKMIRKGQSEIEMLDEDELPEPIENGQIDIAELVSQFLCLSIPPYPHAPGVEYEIGDDLPQPEPEKRNPFAALDTLIKGKH